ncbi:MAG: hypothetical protein R6V84_07280 [Desulfobacterales bacterium]
MEAWRWDLIRDAFNVLLCIGILIHRVRRRREPLNARREGPGRPQITEFTREIRLQALRQQSERALSAILGAVEAERLRLEQLFDADARPAPEPFLAPARAAADDPPFRLGEVCEPAARGRYDGVHELLRKGLSSRQIADALDLPRGEVDLALKLNRVAG